MLQPKRRAPTPAVCGAPARGPVGAFRSTPCQESGRAACEIRNRTGPAPGLPCHTFSKRRGRSGGAGACPALGGGRRCGAAALQTESMWVMLLRRLTPSFTSMLHGSSCTASTSSDTSIPSGLPDSTRSTASRGFSVGAPSMRAFRPPPTSPDSVAAATSPAAGAMRLLLFFSAGPHGSTESGETHPLSELRPFRCCPSSATDRPVLHEGALTLVPGGASSSCGTPSFSPTAAAMTWRSPWRVGRTGPGTPSPLALTNITRPLQTVLASSAKALQTHPRRKGPCDPVDQPLPHGGVENESKKTRIKFGANAPTGSNTDERNRRTQSSKLLPLPCSLGRSGTPTTSVCWSRAEAPVAGSIKPPKHPPPTPAVSGAANRRSAIAKRRAHG
mmetsp:Transcript_34531/g.72455  ORF Transcript_34531/g.72455 Transcript_34531/m.72455 type:complete len:388 (-) Transcript_34531:2791-3954(-)